MERYLREFLREFLRWFLDSMPFRVIVMLLSLITLAVLVVPLLTGTEPSRLLLLPYSEIAIGLLVGVIFTLAGVAVSRLSTAKSLPINHRVAIAGFPRSGKTTLITAMFGEIFTRRFIDLDAVLSGSTTIERVNEDLAMLERGKALGPTTDQDLFAYRATVTTKGSSLFQRMYDVSIGDFPGEETANYSEKYGPWLHTTPFFKWMATADTWVFIVDLAKYWLEREGERSAYVPEISKAIRAAWQHLLDAPDVRMKIERGARIALVFTKTDVLEEILAHRHDYASGPENTRDRPNELQRLIMSMGFGPEVPSIHEMSVETLSAIRLMAENDFEDLIRFMAGQTSHFRVIFTSSFGTVDGQRLGMSELLKWVLPASTVR